MNPEIFCTHTETRSPDSLVEHPRNINQHPKEQIELLAKIIKYQGWRNPIVISARSGFVVKGHGRLAAAHLLGCEVVPVDVQEYKDEASEVADMLADNRIAELSETPEDEIKNLLVDDVFEGFDIELTGFDRSMLNSFEVDDLSTTEEGENYSRKIESPIYSPKMDTPPPVYDLVNDEKANQLVNKIKESDISKSEKEFLLKAAQRHLSFDYGKIAEFYAHADKETQNLMEDSALVIIDFNKAIENGFVKLTNGLFSENEKTNENS